MCRYAQIDNEGYVVSDSHLSGEISSENMIPIEQDFDLINKKYNKETKQWEEYTPEPISEPEKVTVDEQLAEVQENQYVIMDAIATLYEMQIASDSGSVG